LEALSQAGQQIGDGISGKSSNRNLSSNPYGCGIKPLAGYNCNSICIDGQWHEVCK